MLCCGCKRGREAISDLATSPRHQYVPHAANNVSLQPKEPPSMVIQGDFRKVSGISNEIFRQIETIENEYDASTAAALEVVERRGEMIVRILDTKHLGKAAAEAAIKFLNLKDAKHTVLLVEVIKRPGQTLGLYIREGNGLDRSDGVFISRIALESAVYNSGCVHVGDEILAVNLVDVTRMSIDDVVIIMSIPRRLVLVTRPGKGYPPSGSGHLGMGRYATLSHGRLLEPKPPPVVVLKKNLSRDDYVDDDENEKKYLLHSRSRDVPIEYREKCRSQYLLYRNVDSSSDLYYNSRPEPRRHQTSTLDRKIGGWTYTPQSSILDQVLRQPESSNLQSVYERSYPKTLESLAEKVHPFYPADGRSATLGRRPSGNSLSKYSQSNKRFGITRSGSDQHLARTEYTDFSRTLPTQTNTLLRSSFGATNVSSNYNRQYSAPTTSSLTSTLLKRQNVGYASDTEASKSSSYHYCKLNATRTISGISSSTLSRLTKPNALPRSFSIRSNSLPRDSRLIRNQLSVHTPPGNLKTGQDSKMMNLLEQADDGNMSAPEFASIEKLHRGNFVPSSTSVFTADEYRSWLSITPSTSAIYDRLKSSRDSSSLLSQKGRFTFSAENLPERTSQSEIHYSKYRPGQLASMRPVNTTPLPSATVTTLDRHTRTSSLRRLRHLQELEAKHLSNRALTPDVQVDKSRVLEINTSGFNKYKGEKIHPGDDYPLVSGLLWIHLLAGRGLRVNSSTVPVPGTRDLYCVLECDRIHKARTVVRNGDLVFYWDETFELDLFNNRELDFLVYSWDPQYRHKLCYKGTIFLSSLLYKNPIHQLALKVEPRGTLYLRIRHTNSYYTYLRKCSQPSLSSRNMWSANTLFGTDLEMVVNRECEGISVSMQQLPQSPLVVSVPVIVRRCVEEIERRGLDIIGLYRLCGSATKKRILREAFERNPRSIDLSPDNVPDINVITGVFKDYLRELPEPLFTKHLYQMIVDALSVCMSDDPQGNAKLIFSLLDCLSRVNRATLVYVMDHLSMVVSQSIHNKMTPQNLSIIFAPLLIIKSESEDKEIDFNQPINILRYLLEVWPSKSVREVITGAGKTSAALTAPPPPLPKKPNAGSAHVGGPLPIPSKGIRKPAPAVPARYTQTAVESPITENSSSTCSSSDGTGTVVDATATVPARSNNVVAKASTLECEQNVQPSQVTFQRSSLYRGSQTRASFSVGGEIFKDYSNISDIQYRKGVATRTFEDSCPLTSSAAEKMKHRDPSNGYSIQAIGRTFRNSNSSVARRPDTVKIEEALKEISNSTKEAPKSSFGHSRVNEGTKQGAIDKMIKRDNSPWDNIVESWINEADNGGVDDGDMVAAALSESYKKSHKNPFLSDLYCGVKGSSNDSARYRNFSSSFAFCVDSPTSPIDRNDLICSSLDEGKNNQTDCGRGSSNENDVGCKLEKEV